MVLLLANGDFEVIQLNFRDHDTANAPLVITADMLGIPEEKARKMQVKDLWTGEEVKLVNGTIPNPGLGPHSCRVLRIHLEE